MSHAVTTQSAPPATRNEVMVPDLAPAGATGQLLNIIAAAAENPLVDVGKLQALLNMQREVLAEEARLKFNRAMSACQAEMLPVARDAMNSHTRSRYARLETIDAKIRPVYTKHGFSLSFNSEPINGGVRILCATSHEAGHTQQYALEGELDGAGAKGAANKTPIQALGSSTSYLRRYLTLMIFNITLTNEDDDGQRARNAPITSEERLDYLEETIGGTAEAEAPARPAKMVAWVEKLIRLFNAAQTPKAMFALIDSNSKDRLVLMQEAPELEKRIDAAVRAANARLNPKPTDKEAAA